MTEKAVVLVSGGIDSATCLALAADEFDVVQPVHVDYGQQTADLEYRMAMAQCTHINVEYDAKILAQKVVEYEDVFSHFAGGVASDRDSFTTDDGEMVEEDGRSTGYVPMRNLHLISTASAIADVEDADAVFHGAQGGDEEAYPDCRPGFMVAAEEAVNRSLADDDSIDLLTPLIDKSKASVIELGERLDVDWRATYSCYERVEKVQNPEPCGECPACEERKEAFEEAGIEDPHM